MSFATVFGTALFPTVSAKYPSRDNRSSASWNFSRVSTCKAGPVNQNLLFLKKRSTPAAASFVANRVSCNRAMTLRVSASGTSTDKPALMINDISGKMGQAVAQAALEAGLTLAPYSLTGPPRDPMEVGGVTFEFCDAEQDRDSFMEKVKSEYSNLVVVDYTVPMCVNANADLYIKHQTPFVMGTTGGDREKLVADVKAADLYAVIAPQMGKQVVAFQAAMKILADSFPGAFTGYTLKVTESHQSSKVDTSGTAKAIVQSFQQLGLDYDIEDIEKVREVEDQTGRMAVPEEHLLGHAFHTYHLTSPDGMVNFEFQHNVCGRSIYAQGTVDAAICLAAKISQGSEKKFYDMIDVLKEGNMR